MNDSNTQSTAKVNSLVVHHDHKQDFFLIRVGGKSEVISAIFIHYQLGIPYSEKDGTCINEDTIAQSKKDTRRSYARAIANAESTDEVMF